VDGLDVGAAGDLRDHAAVDAMDVDLGVNDVRKNGPAVLDDGRGGLVAGRLDAEDAH
jgi:hypothetical protein